MKNLAFFAALSLAAAAPAFAQSAATAPAAPVAAAPATPAPATAAPAAPELTKDGKPTMKAVRAQCRDEVKASGARGEARRQAMEDCLIKQRPDKEASIKCHMDPGLKGLDKDARKAAVKACMQKARS